MHVSQTVLFLKCQWIGNMLSHPEDVVDEQPPQQDAAGTDVVQVEKLNTVQGEGQPKQVIGNPVL